MATEELSPVSQQLRQSSANSSNASSVSLALSDVDANNSAHGFIVALHRKMNRQDVYFMSSQKTKPSLFGLPVIVPCTAATTHQDLYQAVWVQVARLVSPLPPSETAAPNHAQDCDDSLGYEFPFVLKAVERDGSQCAWCPWYRFCRGCRIQCCDAEFNNSCSHLAIDWDPTALHLRYQTSQEKVCEEHESVSLTRQQQTEPINLDFCLEAFTKEEHLGEDEKYYCSKCKEHQIASKKLQIWRLPPILIVHLKRFQCVNSKWVKSQKVVNFPLKDFDPTSYLASVPKQTIIRHLEMSEATDVPNNLPTEPVVNPCRPVNGEHHAVSPPPAVDETTFAAPTEDATGRKANGDVRQNLRLDALRRERLESTSLVRTPVVDGALQDFHQHRLVNDWDPFNLKYRLYSVVSHSGILGGGHYVSYACNPNGKWYCYNDSSCKEVTESQMDMSSAYMLFYEREGLSQEQYMPNVAGKAPDIRDLDDEFDSDLKKLCSLM